VLEVGCGRGELARAIADLGHALVAIDLDPEHVAEARARGVDARVQDFLELEDEPYDVIVFARSLHHARELPRALARARALLVPAGVVVADELAVDKIDARTARWFDGMRRLLAACGLLDPGALPERDPLERWAEEHRHDPPLHGSVLLLAEAARAFELTAKAEAPYLYRYFEHWLRADPRSAAVARAILALERGLVESGALAPLGLRFVGRRRARA
jgi:SAM-dependent methyltransferase